MKIKTHHLYYIAGGVVLTSAFLLWWCGSGSIVGGSLLTAGLSAEIIRRKKQNQHDQVESDRRADEIETQADEETSEEVEDIQRFLDRPWG